MVSLRQNRCGDSEFFTVSIFCSNAQLVAVEPAVKFGHANLSRKPDKLSLVRLVQEGFVHGFLQRIVILIKAQVPQDFDSLLLDVVHA